MIVLQGQGVSKGIEYGSLYFYHRTSTQVTQQTVEDTAAEAQRLEEAKAK